MTVGLAELATALGDRPLVAIVGGPSRETTRVRRIALVLTFVAGLAAALGAMDGTPMDLASFYGDKPVVLEFWATWCPLCRKLEPAMQAARVKHAGRVTFGSVGVSSNQTPERQVAHATKQKMGSAFVFDRDDKATAAFSVPHTSYVVVIDRNRKVVYTGVGDAQDIEAALRMAAIE
ncbi:MAG: TlpA family protein disulfide reductase [Gemmatimonadaceae bacterium]|nr:TlpA family protein disulfide reductase [Gemmatimonadaceae bacterium]